MDVDEHCLNNILQWPARAPGRLPPPPDLCVLVAERLPLLRALLRDLLTARPGVIVVGEVTSADDLLTHTHRLKPDLVLLDWLMGGMGALQALRALEPPPAVIVLLAGADPEYCAPVLAHGGAACLPREHLYQTLYPALRQVIEDTGKGAWHGQ